MITSMGSGGRSRPAKLVSPLSPVNGKIGQGGALPSKLVENDEAIALLDGLPVDGELSQQ